MKWWQCHHWTISRSLFADMCVILVALQKECLIGIGDQSGFAITAALLRAHPILSVFTDFCANIGKTAAENLPVSTLPCDIVNGAIMLVTMHCLQRCCFIHQCVAGIFVSKIVCKEWSWWEQLEAYSVSPVRLGNRPVRIKILNRR